MWVCVHAGFASKFCSHTSSLVSHGTTGMIMHLTNVWCVKLQDVSFDWLVALCWIGDCEVKRSTY
jgi:hypothetical protein